MTLPAQTRNSPHAELQLELNAISESLKLFEKLPPESQQRAFSYLGNVLGLSRSAPADTKIGPGQGADPVSRGPVEEVDRNIRYENLAELYHAARPENGWQKALVGGYWFQICQGQQEFAAQAVNDGLKEIGAKVANITVEFNRSKQANPSLVMQVRKSGKSQQARKQYRLTVSGIRAVEQLIERAE